MTGPDRLWLTDITEHPTVEGKLYCAAVMDAWSRGIIGWSIAPHIRTELVLDALGMATTRRTPQPQETILHSDHGSQYTSWAFGQRLKKAEILGRMGSVGDGYDNAMMESFWGTLQLEVLDRKLWNPRAELGAVEGLDLRFFVHAQHHSAFRRVQVQADDVADLVDEQRIFRQFPGVLTVWLQPERPPDP